MSGSTNSVVLPPQHDPWAQPQQANPLGIATQAAQLQSMGIANQSNQMMLEARTALGPILQQSIGPDGQIDYNKAAVALSSNPKTAFIANDFINSAVQRGKTQAETVELQLKNAYKQFDWIGNSAAALLQYGPNVQSGQVIQKLADGVASGILPVEEARHYASMIGNMPGPQLYQHLKELALQAQGSTKSIETVFGTPMQMNVGGKTQVVANSPMMGTSRVLGETPNTLTPEQRNAGVKSVGENGEEITTPQYNWPTVNGAGQLEHPIGGVPGAPVPARPGIPGQPGQPATPATPGQPGTIGQRTTALAPAFGTYLKGEGPVADYEKDLNSRVQLATTALQKFDQISAFMKELGPDGMGGGAEMRTRLAQLADAVLPPDKANAIQGSNLAVAQELMKYLTQNIMGQVKMDSEHQKVAQGTFDAYRESGMPTINMRPEAIEKLNLFMRKLQEQVVTEQKAFSIYKGDMDQKTGTFHYDPEFRSNPQGFQQRWTAYMNKKGQFDIVTKMAKDLLDGSKGGGQTPAPAP